MFRECTLSKTNMEVENHLFVVDFMVFLTGLFSTSMLVPGSVTFRSLPFLWSHPVAWPIEGLEEVVLSELRGADAHLRRCVAFAFAFASRTEQRVTAASVLVFGVKTRENH